MKRLEITFSEDDVNIALETYLNRFLLPHRQVKIETVRKEMRDGRAVLSAIVVPAPTDAAGSTDPPIDMCSCRHSRQSHIRGFGACTAYNAGEGEICPCAEFTRA